ncbi:hypothetical protein EV715DRAFT_292572 [Schizophyllum commune]
MSFGREGESEGEGAPPGRRRSSSPLTSLARLAIPGLPSLSKGAFSDASRVVGRAAGGGADCAAGDDADCASSARRGTSGVRWGTSTAPPLFLSTPSADDRAGADEHRTLLAERSRGRTLAERTPPPSFTPLTYHITSPLLHLARPSLLLFSPPPSPTPLARPSFPSPRPFPLLTFAPLLASSPLYLLTTLRISQPFASHHPLLLTTPRSSPTPSTS